MKEHPILFSGPMVRAILEGTKTQTRRVVKPQPQGWAPRAELIPVSATHPSPYGQPGDRLWVRETWQRHGWPVAGTTVTYRADYPSLETTTGWRPSIHMPRWASRITLEVTGVRVERLAEITEADAIEEGVELGQYESHYGAFGSLWDSIYGEGSHALNPWVWVLQFRRVEEQAKARSA